MKQLYTLLVLFFLVACSTSKSANRQMVKAGNNVAATAHPLATKAAQQIFALGGNSVDAAVASAFVLSVVEPSMSGLGGRLQAIVRLPNGEVHGVDATTQSPLAYDTSLVKPQRYGYTTIGIPGVVAGLCKLSEDFGTLPLTTLMQPAIQYAENGFNMLPGEAARQGRAKEQLKEFAGSSQYFLKADGISHQAGDLIVQKDLGKTLRTIAQSGKKAFYEGEIAAQIVADMEANGGLVSMEDLKNYEAKSSKIVKGNYRGYDLYGLWLPSFGAITIEILHILEQFPMNELSEADRMAVVYQAIQLAYKDRKRQLKGDNLATLLTSKVYAKEQAAKISLDRAPDKMSYHSESPESWSAAVGHTTHLSAADKDGMVVALTQSIGPNMGSKVASPNLGFLYAVTLGSYLGIYVPGQRVSSHISPFLVMQDDEPYLGLGAAGGSRIVTAVAQVISRVIDEKLPLDKALAKARAYPDKDSLLLEVHDGIIVEKGLENDLSKEGYAIKRIGDKARFGRVHIVEYNRKKKKWAAAADPDWEGTAAKAN